MNGKKIPSRNMPVVGPPVAPMKVMIIWTTVPPRLLNRNDNPVETMPNTTTVEKHGLDYIVIECERYDIQHKLS